MAAAKALGVIGLKFRAQHARWQVLLKRRRPAQGIKVVKCQGAAGLGARGFRHCLAL